MEMPLPVPLPGSQKTAYDIEAKNVSYKLISWAKNLEALPCLEAQNRPPRFILKEVNCRAKPGEVTVIVGPSGAGKSTLLEILAGKTPARKFSGRVLVNGRKIDPESFRRVSGYVTQDDALFPLLTVEETLAYSALLRLPGGKTEAKNRVLKLMRELGLDHVAALRIGGCGGGKKQGISGGERRRVSIGVDLVHNPAILFMDEPTSGLDSAAAVQVVSLLKSLALNQNKTIVLTIHQPGFRILELLDRIVLLSNGSVFHNGSAGLLVERLKLAGHSIPRDVNVLEFAIDFIDSLTVQKHCLSKRANEEETSVTGTDCDCVEVQERVIFYPNNSFKEVLILGQRFCKNIFRTKQLFAARIVQSLIAGLVLGTIFMNVGNDKGKVALQTRIGFFAFSLTFLLSSTTEGLPIFLQERRILMRETSRGAYRVSSYVLANSLVYLPFLLVVSLLYTTPVYWLVGLRKDTGAFLYFSMVVWMVVLMANSFVACFSALVPDFIMGTSVIAGFMGSFFLFSGYFISKDNIPKYWIFMHYSSLFKYPFECFMINEFGGEQGRRCVDSAGSGKCKLFGDEFLRQQGLHESHKWSNLGVMTAFIIGYRVICFLILWYRCYRTRN